MNIKNRIINYGVKKADQFTANPLNWRKHPFEQRTVVRESLNELGWIGVVVESKRTGFLIDGHERVMQALENNDDVPFIQVDLTEEEEKLALAIFDPITNMAVKDDEIYQQLVESLNVDNKVLNDLINNVNADYGDFERPDFTNLIENVADKTDSVNPKDGNWFYIEFYGDDERYAKLKELLKDKTDAGHQLNNDWFYKMVVGNE